MGTCRCYPPVMRCVRCDREVSRVRHDEDPDDPGTVVDGQTVFRWVAENWPCGCTFPEKALTTYSPDAGLVALAALVDEARSDDVR